MCGFDTISTLLYVRLLRAHNSLGETRRRRVTAQSYYRCISPRLDWFLGRLQLLSLIDSYFAMSLRRGS